MNDKTISVAAKIRIIGHVQRVGYRYFAQHWAEDFGLGGWVKNQQDGSVYLVAEGKKDKIEKLVRELKEGPRTARVDEVKVEWTVFENKFRNFQVKL